MSTIKCEICGSNELIKYEGMFVCNKCGCNYTPEEAKKLYVEDVELPYESNQNRQSQQLKQGKKKQTSLAKEKESESVPPEIPTQSTTPSPTTVQVDRVAPATHAGKKKKKALPIIISAIMIIVVTLSATATVLLMNKNNISIEESKKEKNTDKLKESSNNQEQTSTFNIGDEITFGSYEQDGNTSNGKESIDWIILDKKDGHYLLISKNILDVKLFYDFYSEDVERQRWDDSDIRKWLNTDFFNTAFSTSDKSKIIETEVKTASIYGKKEDIITYDNVFLLSADEAMSYFSSDNDRYTTSTQYAISNLPDLVVEGFPYLAEKWSIWQLRSGGSSEKYYAALVGENGEVYPNGNCYVGAKHGIRPVIWISSNK